MLLGFSCSGFPAAYNHPSQFARESGKQSEGETEEVGTQRGNRGKLGAQVRVNEAPLAGCAGCEARPLFVFLGSRVRERVRFMCAYVRVCSCPVFAAPRLADEPL